MPSYRSVGATHVAVLISLVLVAAFGGWSGMRQPGALVVSDTTTVYGPHVFATPTGTSAYHIEDVVVPPNPGRRYILRLTNGAPNGTLRPSSGVVRWNGADVVTAAQVAAGGSGWTRNVALGAQNTLEVTVQGVAGAYITAELLETVFDGTLLFGPERFVRGAGDPVTESRTIVRSAQATGPFRLCVVNGNPDGSQRISSAWIWVNGVEIAKPKDFNQHVVGFQRPVALQVGNNLLEVRLVSTPVGFLDICALGTDEDPPVLTITAPAESTITNAAEIAVTGTAQDATANTVTVNGQLAQRNGAAFSATVQLTVEGVNPIHVIATDAGGLSTDSSRTVIKDTQAPLLTVTAPFDGQVTNQASVIVSGTVSDATPVTVNVNGIPLPVDGAGVFAGVAPLTEGVNVLTIAATDAAGNQSTVLRMVTRDTQDPVIAWAEPADGATVSTTAVEISGTVTDATAVTLTANGAPVVVGAGGAFTGGVPLATGPNTITLVATDAAGNTDTEVRTVTRAGGLPPDPSIVASVVNRAEVTTIGDATAFLYTGANPIQTGVVAGTINPVRAGVVRGRVLDRTLQPLSGATVTILGHPELGQTLSRADGGYDLAVNGGGELTVSYTKTGYLPAQREADASWQDYVTLEDVVLLQPDPAVTVVDLTAASPGVARGSVVSDADGPRQATLIFKPGTQATLRYPDNTTAPLTTLAVRATEFTVGDSGHLAMPAPLPPASHYTYAVQLSADEQLAVPGATVTFSQPVPFYVENFLSLPIGTAMPVGGYDAQSGSWTPEANRVVLRILGTDAFGRSRLDITGDGVEDPPSLLATLGIDDYEREQLAGTYPATVDLWRARAPRLEPLDLNLPYILVGVPPVDGKVKAGCSSREGDPLRCQLQAQTAFQSV